MGFFDRLLGKECECNKGKKRSKSRRKGAHRDPMKYHLAALREEVQRHRDVERFFGKMARSLPESWGKTTAFVLEKSAEVTAFQIRECEDQIAKLEKELAEAHGRDEPIACEWAFKYGIESHDVFWAIAAAYNEGVLSDHDERYLQQVLDGYALLHPEVLDQARYDLIVFGWGTVEDMQKAAAVLGLTSGSRSSMRHDGKAWRIQGLVPLAQVESLRVTLHALHEAGKLRENPLPVLVFWGYDVPDDAEPADLAKLLEERKAIRASTTAAP